MGCEWCAVRRESLDKAQTLLDAGMHPDHPNVKRLISRARGAGLFAAREHGPVMLDDQCPAGGDQS